MLGLSNALAAFGGSSPFWNAGSTWRHSRGAAWVSYADLEEKGVRHETRWLISVALPLVMPERQAWEGGSSAPQPFCPSRGEGRAAPGLLRLDRDTEHSCSHDLISFNPSCS